MKSFLQILTVTGMPVLSISDATIVEGKQAVLYVWYDNEFGYTCQVLRVAQKMAGVKYPVVPRQPSTDPAEAVEAPVKLKSAS